MKIAAACLLLITNLSAAEPALPLVTWMNSRLGADGVLEAKVTATSGVSLDAKDSTFNSTLKFTKDGGREIVGNSAVLWLDDGKDHSADTIADAVKGGHYAEFSFKVSGLAKNASLSVSGFSYQARPNYKRMTQVHGALLSQAWMGGSLVGEAARHKPGTPGQAASQAASGLKLVLRNGDTFTARIYFAGFDSAAPAGAKFEPVHAGVGFGNVQVFGQVNAPVRLTAFPPEVHAVLQKHCFACHGEKKQKGDLRLDTLSIDFIKDRAASESWHDALNAISAGEMPPEKEPRPSDIERRVLTGWIREQMNAALAATKKEGADIVMRRLNKDEYRFTMTDLLGVPGKYGERLPADPLSKEGFANDGATLGMNALQMEIYLESARTALGELLLDGPQPKRTESREVVESDQRVFNGGGLKNVSTDSVLDRTGAFVAIFGKEAAELEGIPEAGRFTIRVKARAEFKPGQPAPIMRVAYGCTTIGSVLASEVVGTREITDTQPRVYEFSGLTQYFPSAKRGKGQLFQIALVTNALDDAGALPPVAKEEGKRKRKIYELDPDFPHIVVESVQLVGHDYPQWPPPEHRRILFADANEGTPAYAREVLRRFLTRAWRGPVSDAEVARYHEHFLKLSEQMSFVAAMRETLVVALASPRFLYLVEPRLKKEADRALDDYELATRLSYFLWSSMPDDVLIGLAAQGALKEPKTLAAQVGRLLADPKSQRFVEQFSTQWLDLGGVHRVAINPQYYARFDDRLKTDMAGETRAFFAEILRSGGSALQFLDCDWTMLNAKLAKHYGLSGPKSQAFERVSLAGTKRPGGLLGHAAMHLANSNGEDSHPIKRAVWIRERLLHDPPLPPPPNVPALPAENPDFAKLSIREQLQIHRKDPACADCHRSIDAWGVALDHYDAIGRWRDAIVRPNGKKDARGNPLFYRLPVVAKDSLPGGVTLDGLDSLKAYLMHERKDQFARALVTKLLAYALGRGITWADENAVEELTRRFATNGYKLSALIADIVTSEPFRKP